MPDKEQLKRIVTNRKIINPALKRIDGIILGGWIWSSSEHSSCYTWEVSANNGHMHGDYKSNYFDHVRCVLVF